MRIVISFIWEAVTFIFFLIFLPCLYLFSLMMGEGPTDTVRPLPNSPPPDLLQNLQASSGAEGASWFEVVRSLIFWLVFFGIVGYAFLQFARQNSDLWEKIQNLPGWEKLSGFWELVRRWFGGVNEGLSRAIEGGLERWRERRLQRELRTIWRFVRLNQLPAREKVLFFYLAMIRRSRESGIGRRQAQTPLEFAGVLKDQVGDTDGDVDSITRAFMNARYSVHEVSEAEAADAQTAWDRIRSVLRNFRAGKQD
jgi:hypothetical protein